MLCYRNETPISKITVAGTNPMHPGKIEILGVGQQLVGYGIHPNTGRPYTWPNALMFGEPLQAPLTALPEVTSDILHEFAERAAEVLRGVGYTDVKVTGGGAAPERVRADAVIELKTDLPGSVELARSWLEHAAVAVEGRGGDNRTFEVACTLRNFGVTVETALALLLEPGGWNERCVPAWEPDELAVKVRNAYKYAKNAPEMLSFAPLDPPLDPAQFDVSRAPMPTLEIVPEAGGSTTPMSAPIPELVKATTPTPGLNLVDRFRGRWPDEYEQLPDLKFWDDDQTLPRSPDGCVTIVYGEFGAHKTNTVLAMVFDAVLTGSARVCYAAGEGAHGVGKQRIPAHCRARGITTRDLRERMRIVPAVPMFPSPEEVDAFIDAQQGFDPDIIILDTLATAIAGEDENSSKAASYLTANGAAGRIRDAFKALVILLAHQGKDAGKRVRGHSGFMGNADVVLHVEANKGAGTVKVTVVKMRDGRDGFSTYSKFRRQAPPRCRCLRKSPSWSTRHSRVQPAGPRTTRN